VLRKSCVTGGLTIAAVAGTLLAGSAASAQPMGGWGHFRHHFQSSGNSGWNGNENVARNRIRIRIHNRNNNVAVARNEQRQRQRERQWQRDEDPQRRPRAVTAEQCRAGGGIVLGLRGICFGGIFHGLPVR
jgi:hypothetical protein